VWNPIYAKNYVGISTASGSLVTLDKEPRSNVSAWIDLTAALNKTPAIVGAISFTFVLYAYFGGIRLERQTRTISIADVATAAKTYRLFTDRGVGADKWELTGSYVADNPTGGLQVSPTLVGFGV